MNSGASLPNLFSCIKQNFLYPLYSCILFLVFFQCSTIGVSHAASAASAVLDIDGSSIQNFQSTIASKIPEVNIFSKIVEVAHSLNINSPIYIYGGTAAAVAHYVLMDSAQSASLPVISRWNNSYSYHFNDMAYSFQDIDLVVDNSQLVDDTPEKIILFGERLKQEIRLVRWNPNTVWDIRLFHSPFGDKEALISDDFINQHNDSNSIGLIRLNGDGSSNVVSDLLNSNLFIEDILSGTIHYLFNNAHDRTNRASNRLNPQIFSIIRLFIKKFQYGLEISTDSTQKIQRIIQEFNPDTFFTGNESTDSYLLHFLLKNVKKIFLGARDMENTYNELAENGLFPKLQQLADHNIPMILQKSPDSNQLAWWLKQKPLFSDNERLLSPCPGSSRNAQQNGIRTVAFRPIRYGEIESIYKASRKNPNVLQNVSGGFKFFLIKAQTPMDLRLIYFRVNPNACEGIDYQITEDPDIIIFSNRAALELIPNEEQMIEKISSIEFIQSPVVTSSSSSSFSPRSLPLPLIPSPSPLLEAEVAGAIAVAAAPPRQTNIIQVNSLKQSPSTRSLYYLNPHTGEILSPEAISLARSRKKNNIKVSKKLKPLADICGWFAASSVKIMQETFTGHELTPAAVDTLETKLLDLRLLGSFMIAPENVTQLQNWGSSLYSSYSSDESENEDISSEDFLGQFGWVIDRDATMSWIQHPDLPAYYLEPNLHVKGLATLSGVPVLGLTHPLRLIGHASDEQPQSQPLPLPLLTDLTTVESGLGSQRSPEQLSFSFNFTGRGGCIPVILAVNTNSPTTHVGHSNGHYIPGCFIINDQQPEDEQIKFIVADSLHINRTDDLVVTVAYQAFKEQYILFKQSQSAQSSHSSCFSCSAASSSSSSSSEVEVAAPAPMVAAAAVASAPKASAEKKKKKKHAHKKNDNHSKNPEANAPSPEPVPTPVSVSSTPNDDNAISFYSHTIPIPAPPPVPYSEFVGSLLFPEGIPQEKEQEWSIEDLFFKIKNDDRSGIAQYLFMHKDIINQSLDGITPIIYALMNENGSIANWFVTGGGADYTTQCFVFQPLGEPTTPFSLSVYFDQPQTMNFLHYARHVIHTGSVSLIEYAFEGLVSRKEKILAKVELGDYSSFNTIKYLMAKAIIENDQITIGIVNNKLKTRGPQIFGKHVWKIVLVSAKEPTYISYVRDQLSF
ncbi:MAG: hypothetical protein HQK53_05365 [Oligoflexia bacterium]|nr:hypothetical protein [Oligoflexia bacterium]